MHSYAHKTRTGNASYFSYADQFSVLLFSLNIHEKKTILNARKVQAK